MNTMGGFVFSTNYNSYISIKNMFEKSPLKISHKYECENHFLTCFYKINKKNENFLIFENDDFIAASGTLFYNNLSGVSCLDEIYKEFVKNGINSRLNIVGNYCVVIKVGKILYCFVDPAGAYKIYYNKTKNSLTISNNLFFLSHGVDNPTVNEHNLLELAFQYGIIGNGTIFNEINKLMGDELLEYRIDCGKTTIKRTSSICITNIDNKSPEKLANELANTIRGTILNITENCDNIGVLLTGGLDSRLILASFLSVGYRPNVLYGVGNSPLTNTKNEDLGYVDEIAKIFELGFVEMNWFSAEYYLADHDKLLELMGEYYRLYGGNINIYNAFYKISKELDFIEAGYFGEMFRSNDKIDMYKSDFLNLDVLLDIFLFNSGQPQIIQRHEFISNIREKILDGINNNGLNPERLSKKNVQNIIDINRMTERDTLMMNYLNYFTNSCIVYSAPNILNETMSISYDYKKNAHFQLLLINELCPELLNIPFFSHGKKCTFDKKDMKLNTYNNSLSKILIFLFQLLPSDKLKIKFTNIYDGSLYSIIANRTNELQEQLNVNLINTGEKTILRSLNYYNMYLYLLLKRADALSGLEKIKV